MAAWPAGLPQASLLEGALETVQDATVRTEMDVGPAKRRRRYTAVVRRFSVPLILTLDQVATLETFYDSTLSGGVDAFDWLHPRTGASVSLAFVSRYQLQPIGAGYYRALLELELQL
jgi:hypothetical protein